MFGGLKVDEIQLNEELYVSVSSQDAQKLLKEENKMSHVLKNKSMST